METIRCTVGIRLQRIAKLIKHICTFLAVASCCNGASIQGTVTVPMGYPSAANAVVYIEEIPSQTYSPPDQPEQMNQEEYVYIPHVLPILVGTTVIFPNNDPDAHNTYSVSDCCRFNLGTYPQGESREVLFDKIGVSEILCNIHPQMGAYILSLQNPYFSVTDHKGEFQIKDIPTGNFKLIVWHEVLPGLQQEVQIGEKDINLDFVLKPWEVGENESLISEEMVHIPAGNFIMGSDDRQENERPRRVVSTSAFMIDRTEVTNEKYCSFLNETAAQDRVPIERWMNTADCNCDIQRDSKNKIFSVRSGLEKHPVVCVTWFGANAYAKWAGKRLPTEEEWEKAARGTDGREWPWGNEFGAGHANLTTAAMRSKSTMAVGSYHTGRSPYGCLDLAGNVWEWTASNEHRSIEDKVIKGGAFDSLPYAARCSARISAAPNFYSSRTGFRCARDAN